MITKKFIHFARFETFLSKKLSADKDNTTYTIGIGGEVLEGEPDISYHSIVYIKDEKYIFTHGQLYDASGTSDKLKIPVNINESEFDGSGDIITEIWGTSRDISIIDASSKNKSFPVSVNGGSDIIIPLPTDIDANVTNDSEGNNIVETYSTKKELVDAIDELPTSFPASEWTTQEQRESHAGDYYVTSTGRVFYFYEDPNSGWMWKEITDYYLYECQESLKRIEDKVDMTSGWDESQRSPEIGEVYIRGELTSGTPYLDILCCNQNLSYRLDDSNVTINLPFIYEGSWTRTKTSYLTRVPHFITTNELSKAVGKTIIITNESTSAGVLNIVIGDSPSGINQTLSVAQGKCCILKFCAAAVSDYLYYYWEGTLANPTLIWS